MANKSKKHLLDAVSVLMKPLVRLLINNGVSHTDLSDVLKDVYVDSVIRHFDSGEKINRSQIAVMTGLTRKEVKRVIDRAIEQGGKARFQSRPEKVLSGWHNDPDYSGPYGLPLELPYEAPSGQKSFVSLVKTYGSDMSAKATLEELKRGGSVSESGGLVKALRRDFHPGALSPDLIARFGRVVHKVLSTTTSNLEKTKKGEGYFDRLVYAENGCTKPTISKFDVYLRENGQAFLEEIDRWFAANEYHPKQGEDRKETGLYMIHYVEEDGEMSSLSEILETKGIGKES
ncbi:MAG: DUF6502 family protein [Pseudomonadota bacterium]